MRKTIYFILFFLVINIVVAQEFNDYKSLEIESKFSSKLKLDYLEDNYKLDYVTANLTFFPRNNEFQNADNKFSSNPNAKITFNDNFILYRWDNPGGNELQYNLNSNIKTQINFKRIKEKIKFPINENDIKGLKDYVKESQTVTSNDPEIRKKAAELAQGEDDLFILVHKIGEWTKENINYSLETLTEDVSQNSSWVLQNKKGVCDELTSLFVAMLRSINIPARFVTGQAYTNVISGFGNHAWAEVYFPGYGWIPFDPTYEQLGYVDATHITMKDSLDIKESSVNYAWRSYSVEISSSKLNIQSNVTSKGSLYKENVKIDSELLQKEVGPESYIPLKVEIENLNDYYLPLSLYITKAPKELKDRERNVLLKPGEKKKLFFIIEMPDDLEKGYIYTSSVEIADSFNNSISNEIKFGQEYDIYTLQEAQERISQLKEEDKKIYSANVKIECDKAKEFYYKYENIDLQCIIKNTGNVNLNNLNLCYSGKCNYIDLGIAEEKNFYIYEKASDIKKELIVKVENQDVIKNLFLNLNILKIPNLTINNLSYPKKANYNDKYKITFTLNADSEAKEVVVRFGGRKVFSIDSLKGENDFGIDFKGSNFYDKRSDLLISYKDYNDKSYSLTQEIDVQIENLPFYIKYFGPIIIILIILISMILRNRLRR